MPHENSRASARRSSIRAPAPARRQAPWSPTSRRASRARTAGFSRTARRRRRRRASSSPSWRTGGKHRAGRARGQDDARRVLGTYIYSAIKQTNTSIRHCQKTRTRASSSCPSSSLRAIAQLWFDPTRSVRRASRHRRGVMGVAPHLPNFLGCGRPRMVTRTGLRPRRVRESKSLRRFRLLQTPPWHKHDSGRRELDCSAGIRRTRPHRRRSQSFGWSASPWPCSSTWWTPTTTTTTAATTTTTTAATTTTTAASAAANNNNKPHNNNNNTNRAPVKPGTHYASAD